MSTSTRVVSFYLPDRHALGGLDPLCLDPDRDWFVFGTGVYVWVLQTFLRLRKAGAPVRLVERAPDAGVIVLHADHLQRLISEIESPAEVIIVVAQADRGWQPLADFSVVQNGVNADGTHFFIPSWAQPGLLPRLADRGTRVENIAYFGNIKELHPDLTTAAWVETLQRRSLCWDPRTIRFGGSDQRYTGVRWNDYSTVDVVVALRAPQSWDARPKPAAKLQNAWAAGVPAILSPENQYRELYRSPLDYIEAHSSTEVLAAVETLRANPRLYSDMVHNGLQRARAFSTDQLVDRWVDVLWREIPKRASTRTYQWLARSRRHRALARRLIASIKG
jgi:hypothetical protein